MKINFSTAVCKEKLSGGTERNLKAGLSGEWEIPESDRVLCIATEDRDKTDKIFRCIAGIGAPGSGKIALTGCDTNPVFIPEETSLPDWLTTEENISLPLRLKGLSKNEIAGAVKNAIELTGLEGYEDHLPDPKSKGYFFRAELARALAAGAKLILINGSVSRARKELRNDLYRLIRKISDDSGVYFLIASGESVENFGFHSINL